MDYEAVIGLEVHAELHTRTKMFCGCRVVDSTSAAPNTAVCPVCLGLPGVLPVANRQAVEYGLRAALALDCTVAPTSLFARKNYFYPDLPKGYQISQYEHPLAEHGQLAVETPQGQRSVRIRRVHLEEDTGKLTHVEHSGGRYSLVDLNRAGIALLEIVSEPDMHSAEEARLYAEELRILLRTLGINTGEMEKGVIRFEANVSVRPAGSQSLGTRVEIKNLNSFRTLERAIEYQIEQQIMTCRNGREVIQQTLGWDEDTQMTIPQRGKEEAHDYRYFPEPDLPPLVVGRAWLDELRAALPELPAAKRARLCTRHGLNPAEVRLISDDSAVTTFFEETVMAVPSLAPRSLLNWITRDIFAWQNQGGGRIEDLRVTPGELAALAERVERGELNLPTARRVLAEMLTGGRKASDIIAEGGLLQVSDREEIARLVTKVLAEHPQELAAFRGGKGGLVNWFFGQVMRYAGGCANPALVRAELERQLGMPHG